jgi:amino acid adenylation domain-containing protein
MHEHEIISPASSPLPPKGTHAPVLTATRMGEAPITEAQREILLASQLGAEASCAFNESVSLHLDGPLDEAALEAALQQVVDRHEALRLSVAESGDSVLVAGHVPVAMTREDWRTLPADVQGQQFENLLHQEAATPFDLKQAPLFRTTLVRLAEEKSVLVFTGQHIIVDGWSINVVFDEIGKLYSAARTGTTAPLLPVHSFLEQARTEHAEPNADTEAFWLEQFRTLPPPLELPTDRPRGALRDHRGTSLRRIFSSDLVTRLRASSARGGNTLFSTLLSGYVLLLSRLTQQQDIVVGIPMAGQRNFSGESFVGHSVNFLPIRAVLSETTTFAELTDHIKNAVYDALDHQDYTLGTLVRKLKVPRNPARLELVEAQFNLEQVGSGLVFEGLKTRLEANPKAAVNADIFFNFVDRGAEIALEVDYNTGLFDRETIERWVGCLETLLGEAAADTAKPAAQLRWLDEAAEQKILVEWNRTASEYPAHTPVHALFEQQAAKTPASMAIRQDQRSLTYAELNTLANRFARLLQKEHPGGIPIRVALSLDRSPEMVAAILGVLKAGGVYIPVDPGYPAARIAVLLEDSQPTLLLTQNSLLAGFRTDGLRTLTVEDAGPQLDALSGENLDGAVSAESPAYIMYTSGSTGNPKGVIVPHRAIVRLVIGSDFIHFGPEEVFLQLAPVSFDASTLEIWGALLHGVTLALISGNKPSPEEIGEAIASYGVTTMWLTAALFHLMVMDHLPLLKPLKQLLAGGDVLSVSHVRKVLEAMPSLRLVNGYGPTEGTTFTCCHTITLESLGDTVPIGRPINNTRVYILDAHGAPVPAGVPGQLHAAGDGLALGYWRAPELTAAKFIELDLGPAGKERLYRTGDTARYRADGTVLFLGRTDNQVKIRGFRVELGEIEAAAERVPGVRAAIVSARPDWSGPEDIPGDKRLALYFLAADNTDGEKVKQELRQYLQSQLPDHMQPAAILQVDAFPRTANGKVDYRALPAPKAEKRLRTQAGEPPVEAPRTPVEGTLANIWCKVLQLDSVSIHDSIFELGGDSLSIFRITTQANQAGIRMTAKHLFQYKTIAAVAPQLENGGDAAQEQVPARATIRPVSRERFRKQQSLTNVE